MDLRETIDKLSFILWGESVVIEIFERWNQGFVFSSEEPSALVQFKGGPCPVITTVQAYIIKNLLNEGESNENNWKNLTGEDQNRLLIDAFCDILIQSLQDTPRSFSLILVSKEKPGNPETPPLSSSSDLSFINEIRDIQTFERYIKIISCENENKLKVNLLENIKLFKSNVGCLLFLYSLLLTKGIENLKKEMGEEEPLVSPIHGHGTQSLINLLLTGRGTSYVWDGVKEVSGFKLEGINSRSQIGFLTILEHLRYCEVGWHLKNPHHPIWLLGSETHLSIFFSEDRTLISEDCEEKNARKVFKLFDKESRGFIENDNLIELMKSLKLFADPEYVKIVIAKLDPEQLGVITLNKFLDEFFPANSKPSDSSSEHHVFHYNGLVKHSNNNNSVSYIEGECVISSLENHTSSSSSSDIKTCLQTKWPTIEVKWTGNALPTLN